MLIRLELCLSNSASCWMFKCGVPQHVCWWVNYELILTFQKIFLIFFLTWSFESCIYDAYCPTKMVSNSHSTSLYTCFEARSKHWRLPDRRELVEERPEPHQRRSDHGPKLQMVGGYVSKINLKDHQESVLEALEEHSCSRKRGWYMKL